MPTSNCADIMTREGGDTSTFTGERKQEEPRMYNAVEESCQGAQDVVRSQPDLNASPVDISSLVSSTPLSLVTLAKRIVWYSTSAFVSQALTFALTILPLSRVGSVLGTEKLNGASVGLFTLYLFAQYPLMGMGLAVDTLCSQEYGRSHTSRVMGTVLRRGLFMGMVAIVPMSLFIYFVVPYLLGAFYPTQVVDDAVAFLVPTPLYLVMFNSYMCLGKFCFNQLHPILPMFAVGVGALIVTPIASFYLVPFGLTATMFGICLAWGVQSIVLLGLTLYTKRLRHTIWLGCPWVRPVDSVPSDEVSSREEMSTYATAESNTPKESTRLVLNRPPVLDIDRALGVYVMDPAGLREYFDLALPSMILVNGEGSAFDLSVLMAAILGNAAGASWSAVLNYTLWYVAVAGGISSAANALVGSALGRGDAKLAVTYARLVVAISFGMSLINSVVIVLSFDTMMVAFGLARPASEIVPGEPLLLTEQIGQILKFMMPVYHIIDSIQYGLQGVFSGLGRSDLGAKLLMGTLWIIGVPSCIGLGFYGLPHLANYAGPGSVICLQGPEGVGSSRHLSKGMLEGCSDQIGAVGIVLGLMIAMAVETPALLYALVYRVDWVDAAHEASTQEAR